MTRENIPQYEPRKAYEFTEKAGQGSVYLRLIKALCDSSQENPFTRVGDSGFVRIDGVGVELDSRRIETSPGMVDKDRYKLVISVVVPRGSNFISELEEKFPELLKGVKSP